ncbi:DUF943 family protein [Mixta calida]|uniref:DUF943 family protein n=2 Tax=Mixta calida TaxID=665913 RepID=UPI00068DA07E|nr:DUF943 family protein [Mixta calida]POU50234.1 DUF943 domain-containing protein [Pantoea sp. PSNIH5]POU69057.1 DUF943 domain-containing protein [Pantoea sp. PSNIH4]
MKKLTIIIITLLLGAIGFRLYYPTEIITIHRTSKHSLTMLVDHFPWTKKGKIAWWKEHHEEIFRQMNFNESIYSIYIFNSRYKKDSGTDQDSDLLCFEEMATEQNCISKENRPLIIRRYPDGHIEYETESILRRFY